MKKYMLAQNRWHGEEPAIIEVPDSWEVHYAKMRGDDYPAMKYEDIQNAIRNPIGVKPLRELAKERENAIILFENMSRGADVKSMSMYIILISPTCRKREGGAFMLTFMGYLRPDGQVGVRNHVAIMPITSESNGIVRRVVRQVPKLISLAHTSKSFINLISKASVMLLLLMQTLN